MKRQRIRIVNNTGHSISTSVVDADTGDPIHGVLGFELIQGSRDELTATLNVMVEIDMTVDAEVKHWRLNRDTGAMVEIDDAFRGATRMHGEG